LEWAARVDNKLGSREVEKWDWESVLRKQNIEQVHKFTYLGSIFTDDGDLSTDVNCRLGKAAAVFQRMRSIWASSVISTSTKM